MNDENHITVTGLRQYLVDNILKPIPLEEWDEDHKKLAKKLDYRPAEIKKEKE